MNRALEPEQAHDQNQDRIHCDHLGERAEVRSACYSVVGRHFRVVTLGSIAQTLGFAVVTRHPRVVYLSGASCSPTAPSTVSHNDG